MRADVYGPIGSSTTAAAAAAAAAASLPGAFSDLPGALELDISPRVWNSGGIASMAKAPAG